MAVKAIKAMSVVAAATMITGGAAIQAFAAQDTAEAPGAVLQAEAAANAGIGTVRLDRVEGSFSFTQQEVTPNDVIARSLYDASSVLCGATWTAMSAAEAQEWAITVSGDVETSFTATVSELAKTGKARMIMGCTCAGNPVDGRATANAHIEGVTVASILSRAGVLPGVNTITFVSEDGYRVSLPLSYVTQRYSIIVYGMNGDGLCDVAGAANQLWLGSTAAKYFGQNVCEIILSTEEVVPAAPGTPEAGDTYANLPNISVLAAS